MSTELERQAISVKELYEITGISGSTIRYWLRTGQIKGVRVGKRKWLIPAPEVKRIIGALSFSLRNSARFNRPMFDLLEKKLRDLSTTTLRKMCAAPITSGVPPEYSDEGEGFYLSLKQLSPNRLDLYEAKRVDSEFVNSCHIGVRVQRGDILMRLLGREQ